MKTFALLLAVTGTVAAEPYTKAWFEEYDSEAFKANVVEINAEPLTLISARTTT